LNYNSNFIVISLIDNHTDKVVIDEFINKCKSYNLDYIIFTTNNKKYTTINKPILFHQILKQYSKNIVYLDIYYKIKKNPEIFNIKNMDFMTFNLSQNNLHYKTCSDIRILRTLNDNLYFFAYNNVTLQFLQIWNEFNKKLHHQHKNLEYAFNISMSINKMRCYWVPNDYIIGPILHFNKNNIFSFFNNIYDKNNKTFSKISDKLVRCGNASALDSDGKPKKEHHFASKNGTIYHNKYGKLFLNLLK
jgi:hypothetical protein